MMNSISALVKYGGYIREDINNMEMYEYEYEIDILNKRNGK